MDATGLSSLVWRKSSFSTGNPACVEVARGLKWRKSTHSGGKLGCVEIGRAEAIVAIRDTKDRSGAVLVVLPDAFDKFLSCVKRS